MTRRPAALLVALPAAGLALAAAGCGGSPGKPGVASIAASTTPAPATTAPAGGGFAAPRTPGGQGGRFQVAMNVGDARQGAKFSACMRKHGVASFPDPDPQGVIRFGSGMGIDPGSPSFQAAQTACQKLLPNGGRPTPAQEAQRQRQMLAFSACMRSHGIKDFPDPTNGGIHLSGGPGSDLDPGNPRFQSAQRACQGDLPFKTHARAG